MGVGEVLSGLAWTGWRREPDAVLLASSCSLLSSKASCPSAHGHLVTARHGPAVRRDREEGGA